MIEFGAPANRSRRSARPGRPRRSRRVVGCSALLVAGAILLAGCWGEAQQYDGDLVNGYRRSNGRATLAFDQAAMDKAQAWTEHMAWTGVLEHTGGGSNVDTRGVSGWCGYYENVGYGASTAAVHDAFVRSSAHRANMLSPSHRLGTGVVRNGSLVWVTEIYLRNC